jgi:hypothetical protein
LVQQPLLFKMHAIACVHKCFSTAVCTAVLEYTAVYIPDMDGIILEQAAASFFKLLPSHPGCAIAPPFPTPLFAGPSGQY